MFTARDIQWVRNVKSDGGENWSYFDEDIDVFDLHWSSAFKNRPTHAMIPQIGDLVVLFQKINHKNDYFFTHLLTPIDTIERDLIDQTPRHRWARRMKVIAKTKKLRRDPRVGLGSVNQGHTYAVDLLNKDLSKEMIQDIIWNQFRPYMLEKNIIEFGKSITNFDVFSEPDERRDFEGKYKEVLHKIRERSSGIVDRKKKETFLKGKLQCECCGFDFEKAYPNVGRGFIECHHTLPIHKGERITELEHLALVCANCHRMLHRKNKKGAYYQVKELKRVINNN